MANRKSVYIQILHNNSIVFDGLLLAGKDSIYGFFSDKLKDYVSKEYPNAVWADMRFSRDGIYIDPNRPIAYFEGGEYTLDVYYKNS